MKVQSMSTASSLSVRELKPGFGAEIIDVDLAGATPETLAGVVDCFHLHGAIVLRGQSMDPAELVHFASQFGQPEGHTIKEFTLPEFPEIYVLSNRVVNGKPIGSHNDGVGWHTDYSYKQEPVMCTMLYAVEVPAEGADTLIADTCAAYDAMPVAQRERLDGMSVHHSYTHFMSTRQYQRRELTPQQKLENPDVWHPLVRTHPADGRRALWPSAGTVMGIEGMPDDEALKLLDDLIEHCTQPQFVYTHKWQKGDVLVWDNRCSLHTGTLFDDQKYIREMHRLWVRGDKPY